MPATRNRLKIVLCAALTVDGKLEEEGSSALARTLSQNGDPRRHPWAVLYDRAAAVLVEEGWATSHALDQAALHPRLAVASTETLDAALARWQGERVGRPVWCLGGTGLFRALLERGRVDELRLCMRPVIDGRRGAASLSGAGGGFFPASVACRLAGVQTVGGECFLHYRVQRRRTPGDPAA